MLHQSFVLPLPISTNQLTRTTRTGHVYTPPPVTSYKQYAKLFLGAAVCVDGAFLAVFNFYMPPVQGDLDNRCKLLFDVMQNYAYPNDKLQRTYLPLRRRCAKGGARYVTVDLWHIDAMPDQYPGVPNETPPPLVSAILDELNTLPPPVPPYLADLIDTINPSKPKPRRKSTGL